MAQPSTRFSTDIDNSAASTVYRITFETAVKSKFECVQEACRKCIDDMQDESRICHPQIECKTVKGKVTPVDYVCSNCERSLIDNTNRFYVYCPFCGFKVDYTNHEFLREGQKP